MRTVAIYVKANRSDTVTTCVSQHPWRDRPGPIADSDVCWHDHVTDVPDDIGDAEVLRRYRLCVFYKTHVAPFDALKPGALIR
jgi:hypothetical protein